MESAKSEEIKNAICEALKGYNGVEVEYFPPKDGQCGYFSISLDDEYDDEDVENFLDELIKDENLDFDWQGSEKVLDLNADWADRLVNRIIN